ncbi:ABC transmembrane type-1 domain-containing protein [Trichostrongylus colubriformis]|uniref:ABC transmembrane type-1 domain-containing protein n=1 Tax=Trichostrongylus colubriformis TaxID=6319 RepID=A0AAN8F1X6_TRICO
MSKISRVQQSYRFGWKVLVRFITLVPLLFARRRYTIAFAILTLGCAIGNEVVAQKSGTITGKIYKHLLNRDEKAFWETFAAATAIYAGQCLILACIALFSWCLYLCFRKNLVTSLHDLYFDNNVYYTINGIEDQGIDNP